MFKTAINYAAYPKTVQRSILFLTLGWIAHLLCYFKFLPGEAPPQSDYLMVVVGIIVCFFVASINTWARMLCIFGNIIMLVFYSYLALLVFQKPFSGLQMMTMLVIVLFVLATYYLMSRETAVFFRAYNAEEPEDNKKP